MQDTCMSVFHAKTKRRQIITWGYQITKILVLLKSFEPMVGHSTPTHHSFP